MKVISLYRIRWNIVEQLLRWGLLREEEGEILGFFRRICLRLGLML